jgi:hypothetical protein
MNIGNTLPSKIEDLAKFVLIGREQLNMVRAGIKALDKLDMAKDVREQKKAEAQMLAEALMDAEVRIGEILLAMPKASGKQEARGNRFVFREILTAEESSTLQAEPPPKPQPKPIETKQEAAQKLGFNKQQVERFQTLAQHKDIVEQVKQEARANDDLATRTAVLQAVKDQVKQDKEKHYKEQITDEEVEFKVGDEWYTPRWIFDALGLEFEMDVCSPINTKYSTVPAKQRFNIKTNGLTQDWSGLIWCNPPYSEPEPWAEKMIKHNNGIFLTSIPMNALWASKVWSSCGGLRFFQSIVFVRPDGSEERPALWLQIAAFGEQATQALRDMKIPEYLHENPRRVPSPFFLPLGVK